MYYLFLSNTSRKRLKIALKIGPIVLTSRFITEHVAWSSSIPYSTEHTKNTKRTKKKERETFLVSSFLYSWKTDQQLLSLSLLVGLDDKDLENKVKKAAKVERGHLPVLSCWCTLGESRLYFAFAGGNWWTRVAEAPNSRSKLFSPEDLWARSNFPGRKSGDGPRMAGPSLRSRAFFTAPESSS